MNDLQRYDNDIRFVVRNEKDLREQYGSDFIAVYNGEVIASAHRPNLLDIKVQKKRVKEKVVKGTIDDIVSPIQIRYHSASSFSLME